MKLTKFAKLGILITFSIAVLIWGLSYLKGEDIFKRDSIYYVVYDRIDGLSVSGNVTLNGYKIGQVVKIDLLPDNSGRLIVTISVHEPVRFPVNTVAQIISSDLLGSKAIRINLGEGELYFNENDTLLGAIERDLREEVSMQVLPIKNKAEELLGTIDSAITVLTFIFNEDARRNLSESFENFNQTISNMEDITADLKLVIGEHKGNIGATIDNFREITDAFKNNSSEIEQTLKNISIFSDSLVNIPINNIIENIHFATIQANMLLERLEKSDNTAGLLMNDDNLYYSLNQLVDNLNVLTSDLHANPKRYLNFSALDLGRKVFISPPGNGRDEIIFKVHLFSSEKEIDINSEIFREVEDVEKYFTGDVYYYLTGSSTSFTDILDIWQRSQIRFSNATIVAFKNDRLIKVEKALRSIKE